MNSPTLTFHIAPQDKVEFVFSAGNALTYPLHTHVTSITWTLVRKGIVRLVRGNTVCIYGPGEIYRVDPHEAHSPSYSDGYDLVSLCMNAQSMEQDSANISLHHCAAYVRVLLEHGLLAPEHGRLLLDAVENFSPVQKRPLPPGSRIPFLADAPEAVGPHSTHFLRCFKKVMGLTPHQYRLQARIRQAKTLLTSGYPIAEVALMTGFYDQSHLNRWFIRTIGLTPVQYRKHCSFLCLPQVS